MSEQYGEPWVKIPQPDGTFVIGEFDRPRDESEVDGVPVIAMGRRRIITQRLTEERAQRIVACVNFLAGVPTETIEKLTEARKGTFVQLTLDSNGLAEARKPYHGPYD